ncbi:SH2 domain-containing protein A [Selaginella moellendorffii]|uniref:SH2 domain-containing protein A n=1 Tax=Selaginella moellendorffii TaxID=88036 RepID=UPI000D1CA752|nr:SH2 domain-containing protein A [Selaginella moellendorffii]|eukprot:XP_024528758.1 SH2 domain-containing protein A [Selaginella moellendorffii]
MAVKLSKAFAVFDNDEYLPLDDLQVTLTRENTSEDGTYTLCLWMYLLKNNRHPGVIIRQSTSSIQSLPFLSLDNDLRLVLHPLVQTESSELDVLADQSCPVEKWVHVGCEIGHNIARLHIDGVVTGEKAISFPSCDETVEPVKLSGGDGQNRGGFVQAYAHHVCVLPQPSVTNHYVKNPPLELSLDGSTGGSEDHELEEGGDGVWSVVGGKASCRRNFALDVVLLDALGRAIHKDIELVASLVYADTGYLVEKPKDDAEAPLLTTFDGVEFPSTERPIKLVHGRASFKLKISQLSSKCDNRLFRVCFESPNIPKFPFLRVFSRPIRCVSRNRNSRTPSAPWKRSFAAVYPVDGTTLPSAAEDRPETLRANESNGMAAPKFQPSKAPRIGDDKLPSRFPMPADKTPEGSVISKGADGLVGSQRMAPPPAPATCSRPAPASVYKAMDKKQRPENRKSFPAFMNSSCGEKAFSDYVVFKYCLETIHSRAAFLRALVVSKTEEELHEFAGRVSQYTGCQHNGYQVLIAKKLLREGEDIWRQVSHDGYSAPWPSLMSKVEESFYNISGQSKRRFTSKDIEFIQQNCGTGSATTTREQFDRLWQWLYPVAMTVATPQVRKTWESVTPKWIEGMVSRKEAEELLRGVDGIPKTGNFILRFASSRSWPHPDAGALVASYVTDDLRINHRLLNLDTRTCGDDTDGKQQHHSLSELLVLQPELVRPLR